jgi:hypothetical protein
MAPIGGRRTNTYCRRKKLIDEINRISQAEKRDPLEVVQSADNERVARGKNLNWMWEHWVKERREGREEGICRGVFFFSVVINQFSFPFIIYY